MSTFGMKAARIALVVPLTIAGSAVAAPAQAGKAVSTTCVVTVSGSKTTYSTLQAAVDVAVGGETLTIAGVCKGGTSITGVSVTLAAARGGGVLEGLGRTDQAVLRIVHDTSSPLSVTVSGITIRGGGRGGVSCDDVTESPATTLTVTGGAKIVGNRTFEHGGGIYGRRCDLIVSGAGTEIGSNVADGKGGGLYTEKSLVVSSGALVDLNQSVDWAGGIMCEGARVSVEGGSKVLSNKSANFGGGAFSNGSCVLTVAGAGTEVAYNTAVSAGGGVEAYNGGTVLLNGPTGSRGAPLRVHDNGSGSGGGIAFTGSAGTFTLSGRAFVFGNVATEGGGVYLQAAPTLTTDTFTGSTCFDAAGANPNLPNDWDAATGTFCPRPPV